MTEARFAWTVPESAAAGQIALPFDQRAVFGKARPAVVVTVNAYSYRSTVAIMSGATFVPFRRSHREAAGIAPGDVIAVTLTLDTAPRKVAVPDDLAAALTDTGTWDAWHALSYTRQREAADAIETAKRPATRTRRIVATLDGLRAPS